MQFSSLFTVLATGLAFVAAQDIETTTTSTSTLTKTLTITQCNPTVTNCPLRTNSSTVAPTTSSVWSYSAKNTTVSASPTTYANSTTYAVPTTKAPSTSTPASSATKSAATSAATVSASNAGSLMVQSGLLLSVLGAGVALLA